MATVESSQLRKGVVFKDGIKNYLVLDYKHVKKGRGLATVRVKVKEVETGAIVEKTFSSNEKAETTDLSHKSAQYLYSDEEESYFMNSSDYSQFTLKNDNIENELKYMLEGVTVKVMWLEEKPISIELPKKVTLEVVKTGPGILGDTASGATKEAELETGLTIQVPLFMKQGDKIIVNTERGSYVSKG